MLMPDCSKCGKREARLLCSRCQCCHYCSQQCQHDHWAGLPHPHKDVCREMRPVGGVFFEGLQKSSILDLANGKGGKIVSKLGYPVLTANAMALRVSREQFVAALRHARGELSPEWSLALTLDEKRELEAEGASSGADYVCFASPLSSKKRKSELTPEMNSSAKARRASDATPIKIKGADLFAEKRTRKPRKRLDDEPEVTSQKGAKRAAKEKKKSGPESDADESDASSAEELEYTDIKTDVLKGTESEVYGNMLGRRFEDTEDGIRFVITNICVSSDPGLGFFFKYREDPADEGADFEYTPCGEIMEASWVRWCGGTEEISKTS